MLSGTGPGACLCKSALRVCMLRIPSKGGLPVKHCNRTVASDQMSADGTGLLDASSMSSGDLR